MNKLLRTAIIKILVFVVVMSLTSCSVPVEDSGPIPPISTDISLADLTPPPMPENLIYVYPTGSQNITDHDKSRESTQVNEQGIVIGILDSRNVQGVLAGIAIYLDDRKLPNEHLMVADGLLPKAGPFFFSWIPVLLPGLHEAKLQFTTDSGEIMEYIWRFVITEK